MSKLSLPSRRGFLWLSSVGIVAAGASACGGCSSSAVARPPNEGGKGDGDAASDAASDTGVAASDTGANAASDVDTDAGDATPQCVDTDDNIEGPFFKPGSPERTELIEPGVTGVLLMLTGRVFGPGCGVPLAGAGLDFWQADGAGAYHDVTLRGHQYVGADGRFRLHTVIPGHYLNGSQYRPAHIHVKVYAKGYAPLTTQLYFAGDPYNAIDPFIKASLIMPLSSTSEGKAASFDFVLAKSG